MKTVKDVVRSYGYDTVDDMSVGDSIQVEPDSDVMMPLVIEKIDENRLSVAHYYTQRGDLMADPEIVFHVKNEEWVPIRYTQHPYIEQYDPDGLDLDGFVEQWNQNLQRQGYTDENTGETR